MNCSSFISRALLILHFIPEAFEDVDILLWLLHHLHPLSSHLHHSVVHTQILFPKNEGINIYHDWKIDVLVIQVLLNEFVHSNEGSSPANPRAAVDHYRVFGIISEVPGLVDQVHEDLGVFGGGEVCPLNSLKLVHFPGGAIGLLHLNGPRKQRFSVMGCTCH